MDNQKPRRRQQPLGNRRMNLSFWYVVLAVLMMYALHSFFLGENVQQIEYRHFKKLVREKKIISCEITSQEITGRYLDDNGKNAESDSGDFFPLANANADSQQIGKKFLTLRVDDPDLVKELEAAGVKYTGK